MIFPFIKQPNAMDCGPACLGMIAEHYGRRHNLEHLRQNSFIGRDGVSLLGMSRAAEKTGFRTVGGRLTFDNMTGCNMYDDPVCKTYKFFSICEGGCPWFRMKRFKQLFFTLIVTTLFANSLYAQQVIKGKVFDTEGQPLEYFNVTLHHPNDTAYRTGGAFINGEFEIRSESPATLVKISSLGYKDFFSIVETQKEPADIGEITLETHSVSLEEIVVEAQHPKITVKDDKLVFDIKNTLLSNVGTGIDVLKRTPLIVVDNNDNVSVLGKGNVLILIDGRRVKNTQEITSLNSSNIKSIEVIDNPSAKYEAEGHAVVNIVTDKNKLDFINGSLYTNLKQGQRTSYSANPEIALNFSKVSVYASYTYAYNNSGGMNYNRMENNYPDYTFKSNQYDVKNDYYSKRHAYNLGIDYSINSGHQVGVQATGYFTRITNNFTRLLEIDKNDLPRIIQETQKESLNKPRHHTVGLYYTYKNDTGYEISFIADYTQNENNRDEYIDELNQTSGYLSKIKNISRTDYDLYSSKLDVVIPLAKIKSKLESGIKYSHISNDSKVNFSRLHGDSWNKDDLLSNHNLYKETIRAAYLLLSGSIKKINYSAGIRMETNKVENRNGENRSTLIDLTETSFFPNASLGYTHNDNLNLSMSYSRRINRPNYSSLNNNTSYLDSLSVRKGNPNLQPTIFNVFTLRSTLYKNYFVTLTASYLEDPADLHFVYENENNPEQYTVILRNTANIWRAGATLGTVFNYKKWGSQLYFSFHYTPSKIYENGDEYKFTNNYYGITWNNQLALPHSWSMEANLNFYRPGGSYMRMGTQCDLSFNVQKKLMKERLILQLSSYHGLKKWTQYYHYNHKIFDMIYDGDRNTVSLSVRYNFKTTKPTFKSKSASSEERNRM